VSVQFCPGWLWLLLDSKILLLLHDWYFKKDDIVVLSVVTMHVFVGCSHSSETQRIFILISNEIISHLLLVHYNDLLRGRDDSDAHRTIPVQSARSTVEKKKSGKRLNII